MITYDEMPPSAKAEFNKLNSARKITLLISLIFSGLVALVLIPSLIPDNNSLDILSFFGNVILGICLVLSTCSFPHGIAHSLFFYKKLFKTIGKNIVSVIILCIVTGGFAVAVLILTMVVPCYLGGIFVVIDGILFLFKKPLVYSSEHKYFMETQEAQNEVIMATIQKVQTPANINPSMSNMKQLKEMFDTGLITEEEYCIKKLELLNKM